jgi:hypothetical protein
MPGCALHEEGIERSIFIRYSVHTNEQHMYELVRHLCPCRAGPPHDCRAALRGDWVVSGGAGGEGGEGGRTLSQWAPPPFSR